MSEARAPVDQSDRQGTVILALGNPLRGDDGVGSAVLHALSLSGRVPPDVDLVDGGAAGLETALLLQGYRRALVVDAAEMDRPAGNWCALPARVAMANPADRTAGGRRLPPVSAHSAGLADALRLAEALHLLPNVVTIYGVQPRSIGWEPGLSPEVQAAVPVVCEAILEAIGG